MISTVYATELLPATVSSTIFLAGPTPRDLDTPSWRPDALQILETLGYSGTVLLPEDRSGEWKHSYDDQIEWETRMRAAADIIVFWVPRDMSIGSNGQARMPALTTNVEFGLDMPSGKVLYGRPEKAPKNRYLDHVWTLFTNLSPYADLRTILEKAIALLGNGHVRTGPDAYIPLGIHYHEGLSQWRAAKESAGHRIKTIHQVFTHPCPSAGSTPWLAAVRPEIEVFGEERVKSNEVIFSRPDISCTAAFYDGPEGVRVLMVEEFRAAATGNKGTVLELPGGSSDDPLTSLENARQEFYEETGISVDQTRFQPVAVKQAASTLLTHSVHLFALLLSDGEAEYVMASIREERVHGLGSGERIHLRFPLLSEVKNMETDWSVSGMLAHAARALCFTV